MSPKHIHPKYLHRRCRGNGGSGSRKKNKGANVGQTTRQYIFDRDGQSCVYCGSQSRLTLDHLLPVGMGGGDGISNLVTACEPCNQAHGCRFPPPLPIRPECVEAQRLLDAIVSPVTVEPEAPFAVPIGELFAYPLVG